MHVQSKLDRFISWKEAVAITGKSRSTLYRWIEKGVFPIPRWIGPHSSGFLEKELLAWQQSRTQSSVRQQEVGS